MSAAVPMVEIWRGDVLESLHRGHAAICRPDGEIVEAWGDPSALILPRSSCKMIQALPLVESGAADAVGLTSEHLALACASHNGAKIHTEVVSAWLGSIEMNDAFLRCGPQTPDDLETRNEMIRAHQQPCQVHNNCSGKHAGFLTLGQHLGAGSEYIDPDHAVQRQSRAAFEEVTDMVSPTFAVDGCSAPNFATTVCALARGMAQFAQPSSDTRGSAMMRLRNAMVQHPDLVAGEGRACTELMRAAKGRVAIKTGAEGVFAAIVPEQNLGIALKIEDGATRASECAIVSILVRLGVLEPDDPVVRKRGSANILNRRGLKTGVIQPSDLLR